MDPDRALHAAHDAVLRLAGHGFADRFDAGQRHVAPTVDHFGALLHQGQQF